MQDANRDDYGRRSAGMSALTLLAGSANLPLAETVAQTLRVHVGAASLYRFPDGELHVAVRDSLRGHDVYLLQPTSPPFETHLLELFLLADACRRAGAARVTAVVPYFGYARQDRRAGGREPVGARLIADLFSAAGFQRLVAIDLHSPTLEGFFAIPLEHLTAVPALAAVVENGPGDRVIVAPDLGAARLADRYGRALSLPVAMVHKTRVTGEEVLARGVTGDVAGRAPVIVDDMISTGATIVAAVAALREAGCRPETTVVASHALLVGGAAARLRSLALERLIVTDTVALAPSAADGLPLRVVSTAPLLAETIARLHEDRSLADLLVHC
jgi:ribose-phosphate pyrophosphokinase